VPTVTVAGSGVAVEAKRGEAILAALARHGYSYRYGCRRGGCGVCKVEIVKGEVEYPTTVASTVLTDEEREDGTCLSCRAVPSSDVEIRLRPDDRLRCVAPLLAGLFGSGPAKTGSVSATAQEGS
jgi:CDP-4-dehydro-6-deoxyglucose reductase